MSKFKNYKKDANSDENFAITQDAIPNDNQNSDVQNEWEFASNDNFNTSTGSQNNIWENTGTFNDNQQKRFDELQAKDFNSENGVNMLADFVQKSILNNPESLSAFNEEEQNSVKNMVKPDGTVNANAIKNFDSFKKENDAIDALDASDIVKAFIKKTLIKKDLNSVLKNFSAALKMKKNSTKTSNALNHKSDKNSLKGVNTGHAAF